MIRTNLQGWYSTKEGKQIKVTNKSKRFANNEKVENDGIKKIKRTKHQYY